MPSFDVQEIAQSLYRARTDKQPIAPISERYVDFDVDAAYAVQEINSQRALEQGGYLVGRKIGLTSPAVQAQLGVNEPDFGLLWQHDVLSNSSVSMARFIQPKIEAEIAFVMAESVNTPITQQADMAACVESAFPAFEIVDSAIADWRITLADTVADNASCGAFLLGEKGRPLQDIDLYLGGMALLKNKQQVSVGVAAACLGHPLNALMWLANKMIEVGRPLSKGDIVLSGALGPMVEVNKGDVFEAHIQGFAPLTLAFN